jgi:hypothetical protein
MFIAIIGVILMIVSGAGFVYLLPRNAQVHPLVRNSDVGSMVTIVIMAGFTFGVVMLCGGFFG